MRSIENSIEETGGARIAPLFISSEQPTATPIDLLRTRTSDGGIGLSFGYAALAATEYSEMKRREEQPLSEEDLLEPERIENPIRRRWAEELANTANDWELAAFAKFKLDPEDEAEPEETYRHNLNVLAEEAKERAIAYKSLILENGSAPEVKREELDWIPVAGKWLIDKTTARTPHRVSNNTNLGRVVVGNMGYEGKSLESVDFLHPKYAGLKDLRESIVYETTEWVIRDDHPWKRWKLLERKVERGVNLILFSLVADPNEMKKAGFSPYIADVGQMKATQAALRRMYSEQNPRGYDAPSAEEIHAVVQYTTNQLRQRQGPEHPVPKDIINPFRELQNLATTKKLRLPEEFPALRGTLFALETRAVKDTGGPNSVSSLATGPDAFEAVLLGSISTLRLVANYLDKVSECSPRDRLQAA